MEFSTAQNWLAIGVGLFVAALGMSRKNLWVRGVLFSVGSLLIGIGIWGMVRDSGSEARSEKPSNVIQQNNPIYSPPIIGDKNTVTINPEVKPPRILKRDEFVQVLRLVGSSTIVLRCFEDKDSLPFCADLYYLLKAAGWTIQSTPREIGASWVGVQVVVKDKKAAPPGAAALVVQLRLNGIMSGLVENPNDSDLAAAMFSVGVGYLYNNK